jgi:uncharacterized Zn-binding protein involved in type VI secretion
MRRNYLQVGDKSSAGGIVIDEMEDCFNEDTALTFLGARVVCPACGTTGIIVPTGPRWPNNWMGKEMAMEEDLCACKCSPSPIMIASQDTLFDSFEVHELAAMGFEPTGRPLPKTAPRKEATEPSYKEVEKGSTLPDNPALICPNMNNDAFYALVLRLRDKAVTHVDKRLSELSTWGRTDQAKVALYFGPDVNSIKPMLEEGLVRIRTLLGSLTKNNFERYSEEQLARTGCVPRSREDDITAASVCGPDGLHRIFVYPRFCTLPDENLSAYGVPLDGDSKLLTLIHEVSHFQDGMGTRDVWYSTRNSRWKAADANQFCIENAENIAGYTVGIWNDQI